MLAPEAVRPPGLTWLVVPVVALGLALLVVLGKPLYIVVGVGAIVFLPALLRSPTLALLATVAAIPLEEAGVLSPDGPLGRLSLAKIFGAVALLSWGLHLLLHRRMPWMPRIAWWLVLFIAVGLLSLIGAPDVDAGRTMIFRWINTLLFFVLVCNVVDAWAVLRRVLLVFLIVSTAVGAFALIQRAVPSLQYSQRGAAEIADGVAFGAQVDVIEQDLVGSAVVRAGGTSYHPLILALNATLLLPLLVAAVLLARGGWRWAAWAALGINVAALLATGSRSGIVSSLGVLLVLLLKRVIRLNRSLVFAALLLPMVAIPLMPADLKERLFKLDSYRVESSSSLTYRVEMIQAGLSVWADHPVLGIGLGNLTEIGGRMKSDVLVGLASGVHNLYVQVALETGTLGLAVAMAFFLASLRAAAQLQHTARVQGRDDLHRLAQGLSGCVWVLLIYGLSLDVMNFSLKNAWLLLALLQVALNLAQQAANQEPEPTHAAG